MKNKEIINHRKEKASQLTANTLEQLTTIPSPIGPAEINNKPPITWYNGPPSEGSRAPHNGCLVDPRSYASISRLDTGAHKAPVRAQPFGAEADEEADEE